MVHFHNAPAEEKQNIYTVAFNIYAIPFQNTAFGDNWSFTLRFDFFFFFWHSIGNSSLGFYFLEFSISSQPNEKHSYLLQILCQSKEQKNDKCLTKVLWNVIFFPFHYSCVSVQFFFFLKIQLILHMYTDKRQENTHLLQIPQWCVLAGLGMMHFLQTDTNGLLFLSWVNI